MSFAKSLIAGIAGIMLCTAAAAQPSEHTRFVDPFIGTMGDGNVFAGACLPHGFVKLGADTGPGSAASGFKKNKDVEGFSHLHISGMGGPIYGNIQLIPTTGELDCLHHSSPKGAETGAPGYYSVELKKYGTSAELTATAHAGFHRYTFPKSKSSHILVDVGAVLYGTAISWGSGMPIGGEVHVDKDARAVYGFGTYRGGRSTSKPWTVYFYAEFDTPFKSYGYWEGGNERGAHLDFSTKAGQQIQAKVGISMIDVAQARKNLEKEIPDWDFDAVYSKADAAWENELSKVHVAGLPEKDARMFYTALYHSLFCPSDWTGENKVFDYGRPYYEDFLCTWDIQRTVLPLLSLISTKEYTDMVNTLLDVYRHDGWLADAHSSLQREFTQVGSNTDVVIADAYVKKVPGIDYSTAYKAVLKNAMDTTYRGGGVIYSGRPNLPEYLRYGYIPADKGKRITVSRSLEYVYEDFCVSQLAEEFGTAEEKVALKTRSQWYRNLWDSQLKLMRGRNSDGSFVTPFNPYKSETGINYYEGHAYTWTYSVPHDVDGLIGLFGGKEAFVDSLSRAVGNHYQAFNEPCMLQIYLFAWAGRPDLIQKYLRKALSENFSDAYNGLPGNDDSGTTSAWYVWTRMGIFPVAGQNLYVIGSPSYPETTMHLESGKDVVITARNASPDNIYIQSAKLNGKKYDSPFFTQEDIRDGAHFEFEMGPEPSCWGSNAAPSRYVDPMIGSEGGGHVFVGPAMPYGMIKPGPDSIYNPNSGWSGIIRPIKGFSQTHVSGTGGGPKYGNVSIMPISGDCPSPKDYTDKRKEETVELGYYSAEMEKAGALVEITAARKSAIYRMNFHEGGKPGLLIDAGDFLSSPDPIEGQKFVGAQVETVSPTEVRGYNRIRGGWNRGGPYTVYFWLKSDVPFESVKTWKGDKVYDTDSQADSNTPAGAILRFPEGSKEVNVKIGISFLSELKARENLDAEIPGWDFWSVRNSLESAWNELLSRVDIADSATEEQKTMFYTAMYHTMLMPVDRTGENPLWKSDFPYYDDYYAIWDTYRTSMPLITLIDKDRQRDIVNSLLDIYDFDGYMPDARSGNSNGRTQGASNGEIVIADAYVKGLDGIDYEHALEAMLKDATVPPGGTEEQEGRGGLVEYNSLGYIPYGIARSGSRTVDYSYCDYAIAIVAEGLGHANIAKKYYRQAGNWKNLWRKDYEHKGFKGFIMPRAANGKWLDKLPYWGKGNEGKTYDATPLTNEMKYGLPWWQTFFYEGSGWEYSLAVPHDVPGLIRLCGGNATFEKRLDTFFNDGLYNVGNEPSFLSPCLYHWIGKPERTSDRVRSIVTRHFNSSPKGIPGNDDSGAMSSWLIFHMSGLYPVAGQDLYLIHSPLLESVTFHLDGNKDFTVRTENFSENMPYITGARLNGRDYPYSAIRHADIAAGGELVLIMGEAPSGWGREMIR